MAERKKNGWRMETEERSLKTMSARFLKAAKLADEVGDNGRFDLFMSAHNSVDDALAVLKNV